MATQPSLSLTIAEHVRVKPRYTSWKPKGCVIVPRSRRIIRGQWCEIVADLVAPYKRDKFAALPGWQELVDHWTPQLWEAWRDAERARQFDTRLGAEQFWNQNVDAQLPAAVGRDVAGTADLTDIWLFSNLDKQLSFVLPVDFTEAQVEDSGTIERVRNNVTYRVARPRVDWETRLGLTQRVIDRIKNPTIQVEPRYDRRAVIGARDEPDVNTRF